MASVIYVYDVKKGKQRDPRRTRFNKELFGYKYSWETKDGAKTSQKKGLLQLYGASYIGDSVIGVRQEYAAHFDELFSIYSDVIGARKFLVEKEVNLKY